MSITYNPATDFGNEWYTINGETISYEQFVTKLVKARQLYQMDWEHMVIGACGEVGELADAIKRHTIYGKELDRANVVEEMGDLEWYLAGLRQMVGITRTEVLQTNVDKLRARYPAGEYSDAAAIERADKAEPQPDLQVIDMAKTPSDTQLEESLREDAAHFPEPKEEWVDVKADLPKWVRDKLEDDDRRVRAFEVNNAKSTVTVLFFDGSVTTYREGQP